MAKKKILTREVEANERIAAQLGETTEQISKNIIKPFDASTAEIQQDTSEQIEVATEHDIRSRLLLQDEVALKAHQGGRATRDQRFYLIGREILPNLGNSKERK